jgi:hypothetical protein
MEPVTGITYGPDYDFPLAYSYSYDSFLQTVLWADQLYREDVPVKNNGKSWRKVTACYSNGYRVEFIFPPRNI